MSLSSSVFSAGLKVQYTLGWIRRFSAVYPFLYGCVPLIMLQCPGLFACHHFCWSLEVLCRKGFFLAISPTPNAMADTGQTSGKGDDLKSPSALPAGILTSINLKKGWLTMPAMGVERDGWCAWSSELPSYHPHRRYIGSTPSHSVPRAHS